MADELNDGHKRTLAALSMMVNQYSENHPDGLIDSHAMSAREHAIEVLTEYGYMEQIGKGRIIGRWTKSGEALLNWAHPFSEREKKNFPQPPVAQR